MQIYNINIYLQVMAIGSLATASHIAGYWSIPRDFAGGMLGGAA
jgi:hypothetical protein